MPEAPNRVVSYAIAVGACIVTFAAHRALVAVGGEPIAVLFVLPILIAAGAGGFGPGLLATALGEAALVALDAETPDGVDVTGALFLVIAGVATTATMATLHRARRDAAEGRDRFETVFRAMPCPMTIARKRPDGSYQWVDVNDAFEKLWGWSRAEAIGKGPLEVGLALRDDMQRAFPAGVDAAHARDVECTLHSRSGQARRVLFSSEAATLDGEDVQLTMSFDVSARVEAERKLRESEERFRELAEGIREVFWVVSADLRDVLYVSPQSKTMFGTGSQASPIEWLSMVVEEDRARILDAMADVETPRVIEYRIERALGDIRWIRATSTPVRDESGRLLRVVGLCEDITEQKQLEEELHQTQKLESIGRLAGGVAHDFNNLLTVINASLQLLGEKEELDDDTRDLLHDIGEASDRAKSLTRQLLAFSRKQIIDPQNVDVNALVKESGKMLGRLVGEDIKVSLELAQQPAWIRIDPGQLAQVLMNLAVNARDAMENGGRLVVSTAVEGERVTIAVSDTGCGMSNDIKARIFEPFFTTKGVGVGTGLGLAVTHGIVAQSGGSIAVDSAPGKGATFRLTFPRASPAPSGAKSRLDVERGGSETIMLVEDDGAVRMLAARALAVRGFHVIEAPDAATALSYLERDRNNVDLLVTDVVMPGINGRELAERASMFLPNLPVLYVTGYTDDEVVRRGVEHGKVDLLCKPYSPGELVTRVRRALDQPRRVTKPLAGPALVA